MKANTVQQGQKGDEADTGSRSVSRSYGAGKVAADVNWKLKTTSRTKSDNGILVGRLWSKGSEFCH